MKPHRILKTFNGSHDGQHTQAFLAGTIRDLSDSLAAIVVKERWAEPIHAPEHRDTKVTGPTETKVEAPAETKKKKR